MNRAPSRLEPLMERLYDESAVLRPEGLTTRPHTDLYLSGDFIFMCFGNTVKTKKKTIFVVFQEDQTSLEKNSCATNCLIR